MKYLGKEIMRPGDLSTRGIRSTYETEKLSFNETFIRLWQISKQ